MTEPIMSFSDAPNDEPEPPRRRGRPRSPETIRRDELVLNALREVGPQTKEQLVAKLDLRPQLVYLSLWRLRRQGQVERTSAGADRHTWSAIT